MLFQTPCVTDRALVQDYLNRLILLINSLYINLVLQHSVKLWYWIYIKVWDFKIQA